MEQSSQKGARNTEAIVLTGCHAHDVVGHLVRVFAVRDSLSHAEFVAGHLLQDLFV